MTESENTRNILTESFRMEDNEMELSNLNDVQRQTSRGSITARQQLRKKRERSSLVLTAIVVLFLSCQSIR